MRTPLPYYVALPRIYCYRIIEAVIRHPCVLQPKVGVGGGGGGVPPLWSPLKVSNCLS